MFYAPENHGAQMLNKYQPLQIYKWNSYSMLLKVLGIDSYWIIGAPYALILSR